MREALAELLMSSDPALRAQGRELALSLPAESAAALRERLTITDGWLDGPDPPAAVLLSLLLALPGLDGLRRSISRLQVAGPGVQALLPQLAKAMPHLVALDLSCSDVTDLTPLSALPALRELRLDYSAIEDLFGLELLSLRALSLRWCALSSVRSVLTQSGLAVLRIGRHYADLPEIDLRGFSRLHTAELHRTHLSGVPRGLHTLIAPHIDAKDLPEEIWSLPLRALSLSRPAARVPPPTLRSLRLCSSPTAPLPGWPLTYAHLGSTWEHLPLHDPTLGWLEKAHHTPDDLEGRLLHDLRGRTAPMVLDLAPDGRPWPAFLLAAPMLARLATFPAMNGLHAEARARALRHWHTQGHRWQVLPAQPGPYHRIVMIKGLRLLLGQGLKQAKYFDDHSKDTGYGCLTWQEARSIQALGLHARRWMVRRPWSPEAR